MSKMASRALPTALVTGGLLALGTGVASAGTLPADVHPDAVPSPLDQLNSNALTGLVPGQLASAAGNLTPQAAVAPTASVPLKSAAKTAFDRLDQTPLRSVTPKELRKVINAQPVDQPAAAAPSTATLNPALHQAAPQVDSTAAHTAGTLAARDALPFLAGMAGNLDNAASQTPVNGPMLNEMAQPGQANPTRTVVLPTHAVASALQQASTQAAKYAPQSEPSEASPVSQALDAPAALQSLMPATALPNLGTLTSVLPGAAAANTMTPQDLPTTDALSGALPLGGLLSGATSGSALPLGALSSLTPQQPVAAQPAQPATPQALPADEQPGARLDPVIDELNNQLPFGNVSVANHNLGDQFAGLKDVAPNLADNPAAPTPQDLPAMPDLPGLSALTGVLQASPLASALPQAPSLQSLPSVQDLPGLSGVQMPTISSSLPFVGDAVQSGPLAQALGQSGQSQEQDLPAAGDLLSSLTGTLPLV